LHISLDDDLVAQLDRRTGRRQRSTFISETLRRALEDESRWDDIEAGIAALADRERGMPIPPAGCMRSGRRTRAASADACGSCSTRAC
jgi:predicted transcriptional regulator